MKGMSATTNSFSFCKDLVNLLAEGKRKVKFPVCVERSFSRQTFELAARTPDSGDRSRDLPQPLFILGSIQFSIPFCGALVECLFKLRKPGQAPASTKSD